MNDIIFKIRLFFARRRHYHSHEKWGVYAALFAITFGVWSASNLWQQDAPASVHTLYIQEISAPNSMPLSESGRQIAAVSVIDKTTNQPAVGVWIGLRVKDPGESSPEYTYKSWYSPKAGRAFYPTNSLGLVYFPLDSTRAGKVEYEIYAGNPELNTSAKFQALQKSFVVEYQ